MTAQKNGSLGTPGMQQAGDPEPEHDDDEDPGQGPEDVDIDRGQEPDREEDRAGQAAEHRDQQAERQDEDLGGDEQPHVQPERGDQGRQAGPEDLAVEEVLLDLRPVGRVDDQDQARPPKTTTVLTAAIAVGAPRDARLPGGERPKAHRGSPAGLRGSTSRGRTALRYGSKTGASTLSDSHSRVMSASVPSSVMRRDRGVDAVGQRAVLGQDEAEVLGRFGARVDRELPDDLAVVELGRGHVERRSAGRRRCASICLALSAEMAASFVS